ncbi:Acyl-CoA synthetase (AMP-forming)/AMP-acid ligase II [Frankia canadensis]|uniref:Acyl-CoA synthetase (AMP-forming)/AMP-acid ligase II n=1 Tax=Frankia canadensis TaxID=1836972 RepID=A0A2I2KNF7_9ACTN|nr:AMP-binding protein [Frankia canadensis]SNQ47198.1 Acyl-CoA synthetase (AMP-forming)/AMP-acid ligase II [Frankia canadensis]SOU54488.1 Acyl-CoA synthetase (AMP-forming)/AMP-acid ligase II [Frankia canadensis]
MRGLTLPGALDEAAAAHPDTAVTFPSSHERVSLAELADATVALARGLVADGVEPGERVGVFSRNNADFLVAVIGVTRAGAVACPLPLPTSAADLAGYAARLVAVTAAAGARRVVTGAGVDGIVRRLGPILSGLSFAGVATTAAGDGPAAGGGGAVRLGGSAAGGGRGGGLPVVAESDVAIVQFTSGSTSLPKGVVLTHRNVVHGTAAIVDGIELGRPGDHGATWLPLYHDMGLFGTLAAVLIGTPMTVWAPSTFIKDPAGWLRDFAAMGCTVSPSPNFGYDALLTAVGPDELVGVDLRRWRIAFNGAEPVNPATVDRFLERFGPAGFAAETMFPVYGMAEATLAVTFPPLGRGPVTTWVDRDRLARDGVANPAPAGSPGARGLVALGGPVRGMRLRVVDEKRQPLPDGTVGEIEIGGDAVTAGYLTADADPTITLRAAAAAAAAAAAGAGSPAAGDAWLGTGDLGFVAGGELYISGRRKEMIIIRGVNYYPEDAEALVRDAPGVHRRRCVAVADMDDAGGETLTVIAETSLEDAGGRVLLEAELRASVAAALGLSEVAVRLVAPDALPRTSSGKFRRAEARDLARSRPR